MSSSRGDEQLAGRFDGSFAEAIGFWVWGLIVIGLSITLVPLNYRLLAVFNKHNASSTIIGLRGPHIIRIGHSLCRHQ